MKKIAYECGGFFWLEYFSDGSNASFFTLPIQNLEALIVPTISIYEVFKKVLFERGEDAALQAIALMQQGHIVDLDTRVALLAGKLGLQHKLPMADSIVLATAQIHKAILWTQDADFKGIKDVKFVTKKKKSIS